MQTGRQAVPVKVAASDVGQGSEFVEEIIAMVVERLLDHILCTQLWEALL
ncbi:MAG: hypothetical protein C1O27_001549 [Chloroflexi bacterium]|jgi:hypothetical protein|nr:MAG: hypothetical protein C1O27_001549 [Chloroflexota bacterium]